MGIISFDEVKQIFLESIDDSSNINELIKNVANRIYQKGKNEALVFNDVQGTNCYGDYKKFHYQTDRKNDDIKEKLIELITEMNLNGIDPDWNTMQVIFHDYLDGLHPWGPSTIAIKLKCKET